MNYRRISEIHLIVVESDKIITGVAVDRMNVTLFMVIEDAVSPKGAATNDVTVRKNVSLLCVNYESCSLARDSGVRIEGAGLAIFWWLAWPGCFMNQKFYTRNV